MTYDVLIIGGGPGGIYTAWELLNKRPDLKLALFESGHTLERRRCPIDGVKVKSCVHCPTCAASAAPVPFPTESITSPISSAAPSTSTSARRRRWN